MGRKNRLPLTPKQIAQRRIKFLSKVYAIQEDLTHHYQTHPVEELHTASLIVMLGMDIGSSAEVFCDDHFWKVTIEEKTNDGFHFTYDETDDEYGFVYTKDYLKTWRLYEEGVQVHLTKSNLMRMRDSLH
jgi:hypothetical protein